MNQSPEFALAVQCCQQGFARADAIHSLLLPEKIDWPRFVRLVTFHRIEGLAWNALSRVDQSLPGDISLALTTSARDITIRNLHSVAKSRELRKRFEEANVPLLFLKGSTLGALAYPNPSLKSSIDIDVLIDPGDLGRSVELLGSCGFRLAAPSSGNIVEWHQRSKESVWTCNEPWLQLDLHTRVADNKWLIPSIDSHSPTQLVEVGNDVRLPTFATEILVAYLAVHGASSAWFRLKWIADFGGLIDKRDAGEIDQLYRRSRELGAGRCAGQALLLADSLFSILDDAPALRKELSSDRAIARLCRIALRFLTADKGEPTARRLGTFTIHRTQFDLQAGLPFKAAELSLQVGRLLSRLH